MIQAFMVSQRESALIIPFIPDSLRSRGDLFLGCVDEENVVCAAAVFQTDDIHLKLIYIYVVSEYRRCGAGTAMLDMGHRIGLRRGLLGMEVDFFRDMDTSGLYGFFKAAGFEEDDDVTAMETVTLLEELDRSLTPFAKKAKSGAEIISLGRISKNMYFDMQNLLREHGDEDDVFTLLPMDCYEKDLSFFAYMDKKPVGGIVLQKLSEDELKLSYLWAFGGNTSKLVADLMLHALNEVMLDYPWTTKIRIIGINDNSKRMIERLSGTKRSMRQPVRLLYAF